MNGVETYQVTDWCCGTCLQPLLWYRNDGSGDPPAVAAHVHADTGLYRCANGYADVYDAEPLTPTRVQFIRLGIPEEDGDWPPVIASPPG